MKRLKVLYPNGYWIGGLHSITWKPEKLAGQNGSLAQKAEKYGPLAEVLLMPLILCVYLEFTSALDSLDLSHSLYGYPVDYIGERPFNEYYPNTQFHNLTDALYYSNPQMMKNVSGVLLRGNSGSYVYYNNFSLSNRLSSSNLIFFSDKQHRYNNDGCI